MNRSLFLVLIFMCVPAQMVGMEYSLVPHKPNKTLSSIVSKLPFFPLKKTDALPSIGQVIQTFGVARTDIMCGLALLPSELQFDIVNKLLNDKKSVNYFLEMPFLSAITKLHEQSKKQEAGNLFLKTINPGTLFRMPADQQSFLMEQGKKSHVLEPHMGTIMITSEELTDVLVAQEELEESFFPENTPVLVVNKLTCYKKCMISRPLIFAIGGTVATGIVLSATCATSDCPTAFIGIFGAGIPLGSFLVGGAWSLSRYIDAVKKNSYSLNI